jgi:hypothetical protein
VTGNEVVPADNKVRWAADTPGAGFDWFEFSMQGDPETHGEVLRVRMNVSFLLSSWKCIFGQGCPGVLISGAMTDRGCCQIGVHMEHDDEDYKRVRKYVGMLTEEDLDEDLLKVVRSKNGKGWRYRDTSGEEGDSNLPGYDWHTTVVDGACVLANRAGGSTGKLGCSLHVLANRLGVHHSETKPNICWQIPIAVETEYDEESDQTLMTVDGSRGATWGQTNPTDLEAPGWWCTETPDAYVTGNPDTSMDSLVENQARGMVFRTNEFEMRRMMTDQVYEQMVTYLYAIMEKGGRRWPMPGEVANGGRPLIPLHVKARLDLWADDETPDSMDALRRSRPYMKESGYVPAGYAMPRKLKRREPLAITQGPILDEGTPNVVEDKEDG